MATTLTCCLGRPTRVFRWLLLPPLPTTSCTAKEVKYCCDRKEAKDHGADKGNLLGYEPKDGDRVVMVEDVTTSGKSIDETYPKVKAAADVEIKGLIVSLNRMEVGKGWRDHRTEGDRGKVRFPRREHRFHGRGRRDPLQPRDRRQGRHR